MPAKFDKCLRTKGSRVRTIKPNSGTYIHVCFPRRGKSVAGEVKHNKQRVFRKSRK